MSNEDKIINRQKPIAEFYCYYYILKLIFDGKKEVTTTSILDALLKKDFFQVCYGGGKENQATKKRVQRLITDVYHFYGENAFSEQLIERKRDGNQFVYSMAEGKTSPLDKSVIENIMPLRLVEDNLILPPNMKKGISEAVSIAGKPKEDIWSGRFIQRAATFEPCSPEVDKQFLTTIENAIEKSDAIEIEYKNKKRQLDPYGIFVYGKVFYLIADERVGLPGSTPLKFFAIHRMESVTKLEKFHIHCSAQKDNFSIEEFILSENGRCFNGGEEVGAKFKLHRDKYHGYNKFLTEYRISEDQKELKGESNESYYIVKATVRDNHDLIKWLMTQSLSVEILTPVEIREKVAGRLKEAMGVYSDAE